MVERNAVAENTMNDVGFPIEQECRKLLGIDSWQLDTINRMTVLSRIARIMSRGMRDSDARGIIELGDQSRLRTIDFENVDIKGYRKYAAGEATVAVVRCLLEDREDCDEIRGNDATWSFMRLW